MSADDYQRGLQDGFAIAIEHLERRLHMAEGRTLIYRTARIAESASAVAEELAADIEALNVSRTVAAQAHQRLDGIA